MKRLTLNLTRYVPYHLKTYTPHLLQVTCRSSLTPYHYHLSSSTQPRCCSVSIPSHTYSQAPHVSSVTCRSNLKLCHSRLYLCTQSRCYLGFIQSSPYHQVPLLVLRQRYKSPSPYRNHLFQNMLIQGTL